MLKIKNPRFFFTAPYSNEHQPLRNLVIETLQKAGVDPLDDDVTPGSNWVNQLNDAIEEADFIIADLTGSNPNVMYEVGYAHALRKPLLPIVQSTEGHIPSSLAGYHYLVYDPNNPDQLREAIQNWVNRNLVAQPEEQAS